MLNKTFFDTVQEAQATGEPVARYIKAIKGNVAVEVIDPFTGGPTTVVLHGDTSKDNIDNVIITAWTPFENEYFRRSNRKLLDGGFVAPYSEEIVREMSVNEISDNEIREILAQPFFSLKALLDSLTAIAPVNRVLAIAEDMNKPSGTIKAIQVKLSELQGA